MATSIEDKRVHRLTAPTKRMVQSAVLSQLADLTSAAIAEGMGINDSTRRFHPSNFKRTISSKTKATTTRQWHSPETYNGGSSGRALPMSVDSNVAKSCARILCKLLQHFSSERCPDPLPQGATLSEYFAGSDDGWVAFVGQLVLNHPAYVSGELAKEYGHTIKLQGIVQHMVAKRAEDLTPQIVHIFYHFVKIVAESAGTFRLQQQGTFTLNMDHFLGISAVLGVTRGATFTNHMSSEMRSHVPPARKKKKEVVATASAATPVSESAPEATPPVPESATATPAEAIPSAPEITPAAVTEAIPSTPRVTSEVDADVFAILSGGTDSGTASGTGGFDSDGLISMLQSGA